MFPKGQRIPNGVFDLPKGPCVCSLFVLFCVFLCMCHVLCVFMCLCCVVLLLLLCCCLFDQLFALPFPVFFLKCSVCVVIGCYCVVSFYCVCVLCCFAINVLCCFLFLLVMSNMCVC